MHASYEVKLNVYSAIFDSPIGKIGIISENNKIIKIDFLPNEVPLIYSDLKCINDIINEFEKYFQNSQHTFNVNIQLHGSIFQQKVWRILKNIPSGKTSTYGALAQFLNTSPRAVGQALKSNPFPILIPCHRVVARNHLGGYAGNISGKFKQIKNWLLQHEAIL